MLALNIINDGNDDRLEYPVPAVQWTKNCFNGKCYPATRLAFQSAKPVVVAENQIIAVQ